MVTLPFWLAKSIVRDATPLLQCPADTFDRKLFEADGVVFAHRILFRHALACEIDRWHGFDNHRLALVFFC